MTHHYARMLADERRIQGFQDAIQSEVRPDDVVVDLGCGLGTFAMIAARAGARRVFGIEVDPVIGLARQIADRNGVKVEFFRGDARDVQLPEPATLLIFEDFTTGLLDGRAPKLLELALQRWMADRYRVIPQGATLNVAPISSNSVRVDTFPFESSGGHAYGFDLQPIVDAACNSIRQIKETPDLALLAAPEIVLERRFVDALPTNWVAKAAFQFDRNQLLDGVCLWHDIRLGGDATYTNHPKAAGIWGQCFFPTPARWAVIPGDRLQFEIAFRSAFDEGNWKWKLALERGTGELVHRFSANTFASSPLTGQWLNDYRLDQIVQLTDRARLEALILSLADGTRSIDDICDEVEKHCDLESRAEVVQLVLGQIDNRRIRDSSSQSRNPRT